MPVRPVKLQHPFLGYQHRVAHIADPSCPICRHEGLRALAAHELHPDAPAPHPNPEGGHTWFHGTFFHPGTDDDPDDDSEHPTHGGELDPDAARGHSEHNFDEEYLEGGFNGRENKHSNTDYGTHFTSLEPVAQGFSTEPTRGGFRVGRPHNPSMTSRVAHANLHMTNPAHYPDEESLAQHAIHHALSEGRTFAPDHEGARDALEDGRFEDVQHHESEHHDARGHHVDWATDEEWGNDNPPLSDSKHLQSDDQRSTIAMIDRHKQPSESWDRNENWLSAHPQRDQNARAFVDHLKSKGHDGIVYGNSLEGPKGHACAIAFHDTPVHVHNWEWMHPGQAHLNKQAARSIDLYHRTTPEAAEAIHREKRMTSHERNDVFFSNRRDGVYSSDYGTGVVHVRVPEHMAELDDEFGDGEQHFRVDTRQLQPRHFVGTPKTAAATPPRFSTAFTAAGFDHTWAEHHAAGLTTTAALHDIVQPSIHTPRRWDATDDEHEADRAQGIADIKAFPDKVRAEMGVSKDDVDDWDARQHWTRSMMGALTHGHVDLATAKSRGYRGDGREMGEETHEYDDQDNLKKVTRGGWQPLPPKVYHVGTNADAIQRDGLKTRHEQGGRIAGLGGGGSNSEDTVSVTADPKLGPDIYHSLHEHHAVIHGHISVDQLMHHADHPPEGVKPFRHEAEIYGADERTRARAADGSDPHQQIHARSAVYKAWATARMNAGGHRDPLYMGNDAKAFSEADPKTFGILHLKSNPGAQGYPLDGNKGAVHNRADSGEWRLGPGSPFHVEKVEKPRPRHLDEFGLGKTSALGPITPASGSIGDRVPYHATYRAGGDTHYIHKHENQVWSRLQGGKLTGTLGWDSQGEVGNAHVHEDYRRQGLGSALWDQAKRVEPSLHHSDRMSSDAQAWAQHTAAAGTVHMRPSELIDRLGRDDLDKSWMQPKIRTLQESFIEHGFEHGRRDHPITYSPEADRVTDGNKTLYAMHQMGLDEPVPVHRTAVLFQAARRCPCGMPVEHDALDGWQHADGSVSHDGEFYGRSVSDLVRTAAYFHNTDAELKPGDVVEPASARGHDSRWKNAPGYSPHHVYVYDQHDASGYDDFGRHRYEVEPLGPIARDPEFEHNRRDSQENHVEEFGSLKSEDADWDERDVLGYHSHVTPRARVIRTAARWQHPTKRVFTHTDGLDHRLFNGEKMRPEIRLDVMGRFDDFCTKHGYAEWRSWAKLVFFGSEASEWTSTDLEGNGDFDLSLGIEYDVFRRLHKDAILLTNAEIAARLTAEMHAELNDPDHHFLVDL